MHLLYHLLKGNQILIMLNSKKEKIIDLKILQWYFGI